MQCEGMEKEDNLTQIYSDCSFQPTSNKRLEHLQWIFNVQIDQWIQRLKFL